MTTIFVTPFCQVTHAAMVDGCLILGDDKGSVAMVKPDGKFVWKVQQSDPGTGGFVSRI